MTEKQFKQPLESVHEKRKYKIAI